VEVGWDDDSRPLGEESCCFGSITYIKLIDLNFKLLLYFTNQQKIRK